MASKGDLGHRSRLPMQLCIYRSPEAAQSILAGTPRYLAIPESFSSHKGWDPTDRLTARGSPQIPPYCGYCNQYRSSNSGHPA